ncbi:phage regulatory CII family protein [Acinetobacter baumannii]|uniref:phage regulatory CII family protein n=1 Tax=Acinetobacter baumannii TaxID=470 RepID=UPI00158013BA|nr:phage regulatory CII family protein [Acinetobacter baumannii]MDC4783573.1 phage regulatory CII family protein [Acinetobacter baumannii]NUG32422.1 phage regulatory CII family protein [Acinetobacter baumannii]
MNILDAAYNTVHDFKGGANALASRMGIKSPAVLNSKVNPNTETHHLTLLETTKLMGITGDFRILQALCAEHGKAAIDLPNIPESHRDTCLVDTFLNLGIKKGNVTELFREMLADGRVTKGEAIDIAKIIRDMHILLATLEQQINTCIQGK